MSLIKSRRPAADGAPRSGSSAVRRSWPVIAGAAVLVAVSTTGGAVAGSLVTGEQIKNYTISHKDLKTGAVDSRSIADGAVQSKDLAADAVAGLKGATGEKGATGPTGATGVTGAPGAIGPAGADGDDGANGQGVPTGGTAGQVLSKVDGTSFNTQWTTPAGGGDELVLLAKATSFPTADQNIRIMAFDNELSDPDGQLSGGTFTAASPGVYRFEVHVRAIGNGADFIAGMRDQSSGVLVYGSRAGTGPLQASAANGTFVLSANDVVTLEAGSLSTGSVNIAPFQTVLKVFKVG